MKQQITTGDTKSAHILSQGIISNGLIFVSGQVHCDAGLQLVGDTTTEKVTQCMKNIEAILKAADATLDNIVKAAGNKGAAIPKETLDAYEGAATRLTESAEDGEVAGHESSQTSQEQIEATSKRSVELVTGVSLIGLLLALTMSVTLSRAILIPVEHLKQVAENVSMGNLDITVHRYSEDEIGDLADSFSRMVTAVKFFRSEVETVQAEAGSGRGGR